MKRKEKRRQMRKFLEDNPEFRRPTGFASRLSLTEFEGDDIGWGQRLAGYAGAGAGGALGAIPLIKKPWKAWAVGSVGAAAGYVDGCIVCGTCLLGDKKK